jgi:hypothetical protein
MGTPGTDPQFYLEIQKDHRPNNWLANWKAEGPLGMESGTVPVKEPVNSFIDYKHNIINGVRYRPDPLLRLGRPQVP